MTATDRATPVSSDEMREAVEAARRIERERYVGSQFIRDARTVARALLSLSSQLEKAREEMREEAVKVAEEHAVWSAELDAPVCHECCTDIARRIRSLKL